MTPSIQSVLAIDPGNHTGMAYFQWTESVGWTLLEAFVCSPDDTSFPVRPDLVVIECPTRVFKEATVQSILKLARCAGRYEERFAGTIVELIEPRAWKGSIDGDIMIARIEAAMTPAEKAVLARYTGGYAGNAVDAIGIGKWALRQPFMRQARRAKKSA